jgi:thymidylate kinase
MSSRNGNSAGRLIAVEGSGGRSMMVAAKRLQRSLGKEHQEVGISVWDASAIFFQIQQGARGIDAPSARTLILLYASDLAFRLRWQIQPALEDGYAVIAAPYVESVIGFGRAAGLPRLWLNNIFAFAPAPAAVWRVPEEKILVSRRAKTDESFLEFSLAQLRGGPAVWDTEAVRRGFYYHLEQLQLRGKAKPVGELP